MMKGRRRQHLLAVCVLMVVARGFWKSRASHLPAVRPPLDRRRLLFATLQVSTQPSLAGRSPFFFNGVTCIYIDKCI